MQLTKTTLAELLAGAKRLEALIEIARHADAPPAAGATLHSPSHVDDATRQRLAEIDAAIDRGELDVEGES